MKVLAAFDKFKDCMDAQRACSVAADALKRVLPDAEIDIMPLTDGGEDFCRILTEASGGRLERHAVRGPRGDTREALVGFVPFSSLPGGVRALFPSNLSGGGIAVVEMAQASGLWGLPVPLRDPWLASSFGSGQLLKIAAERGAAAILVGIGGSATCDLGLGALEALGLEFEGPGGSRVGGICPARWKELRAFSGQPFRLPPLLVACDVRSPLCGPDGAAALFGPQKGLPVCDVPALDAEMDRVGRMLAAHFGKSETLLSEPSSGAAGGMGFGLRAACGAVFTPGFDLFRWWVDMDRRIAAADVVLTGEGRYDSSSAAGKGPCLIARLAAGLGRRTVVLAGSLEPGASDGESYPCLPLAPEGMPLPEALEKGPELLARKIAALFSRC